MLFLLQSYVLRPPNFCQIAPFDVSTAGSTQWALYPQLHTVIQCEEKVRLGIWRERERDDDVHTTIQCMKYTEPVPFPLKGALSLQLWRCPLTFLSSQHPKGILDEINAICFSVTFIEILWSWLFLLSLAFFFSPHSQFECHWAVFFSWWAETLKVGHEMFCQSRT